MKTQSIIHKTCSSTGSSESSEVYMIADLVSGETQLVIEKTITERYPITDYDKVMKLYEEINAGGGRITLSLKDFTKH
jgi:hypothetical protein